MQYKSKVLVNNTKEDIEFMCGGTIYKHPAGEKIPYEGFVAHHALNQVRTGLKEYSLASEADVVAADVEDEVPEEPSEDQPIDLDTLSWPKLVSMAGSKYKIGMKKADVIKVIRGE